MTNHDLFGVRAHMQCTECGKRPEVGDVFTANAEPNSWRHTDCDDPKLEHGADA